MDLREAGLNRLPSKFERRVLAAGLALSLGVSALAGCSSSDADAEPKPGKTYEAVSVPNPEPTETESAEPTPTQTPDRAPVVGTISAEMQPYADMSVDDYNSVDEDTQLRYWAELVGGRDNLVHFANDAYRVSQDERDLVPEVVSENSTDQEIMTMLTINSRTPLQFKGDDREKAAISIFEDDRGSLAWDAVHQLIERSPEELTGGAIAYDELVTFPEIISSSENQTLPGTEQVVRDITVSSETGGEYTVRAYYKTISFGDSSFSWWTSR